MNYKIILVFLFVLFSITVVNAQDENKYPPPPPIPVEDIENAIVCNYEIITFSVWVENDKNEFIENLIAKDFRVYLDGKLKKIEYFEESKVLPDQELSNEHISKKSKYILAVSPNYEVEVGKRRKFKIDLSEIKKKEIKKFQIVADLHKEK